eukprot:13973058-Ditylum_brightwellii.AAC.1
MDQLWTIVQNISDLNNDNQEKDDLTNNEIVLAIMGQPAMKNIGKKSHATRCKLKKEENWDEWLEEGGGSWYKLGRKRTTNQ